MVPSILSVHCSVVSWLVCRDLPSGVDVRGVDECILMAPEALSFSVFMPNCEKGFCCTCVVGALSACGSTLGGAGEGAAAGDGTVGALSVVCGVEDDAPGEAGAAEDEGPPSLARRRMRI